MAFTDFELTGTQATVLHSAAPLTTNPLTTGGSYCRSIALDSSVGAATKMYFTTSSYGGAFYNVPDTKVVSGRACFRYDQGPYLNPLYITIKDTRSFISGPGVACKGYKFGFSGGVIKLMGDNNSPLIVTGVSTTISTWYSLRMDVFPLGALGDRIICYKESAPGSGTWNSTIDGTLFDITVAVADARYAAWGNNNRNGIHTGPDGNSPGPNYVDNINFTTYNAP